MVEKGTRAYRLRAWGGFDSVPRQLRFLPDWIPDDTDTAAVKSREGYLFEHEWWGIAGILHCLLWGKHMDAKSVRLGSDGKTRLLSNHFKRYWKADMWGEIFHALLNPEDDVLPSKTSRLGVEVLDALAEKLDAFLIENSNKAGKSLKGLLVRLEIAMLDRRWFYMSFVYRVIKLYYEMSLRCVFREVVHGGTVYGKGKVTAKNLDLFTREQSNQLDRKKFRAKFLPFDYWLKSWGQNFLIINLVERVQLERALWLLAENLRSKILTSSW